MAAFRCSSASSANNLIISKASLGSPKCSMAREKLRISFSKSEDTSETRSLNTEAGKLVRI